MARVLVTEKIAPAGLDRLRQAGHDVVEALDLDHEGLLGEIRGAHALIIRSATQVTADVLAAGVGLVVVGRAGIGLDNVDITAATRQGVMVVNAPQSNILSAAEHTMALLLAQARNIPQAHRALVEGRWERSRWEGVELSDKVLGIVGLGRIGRLVAQRASAFGMRLVGHDPFVSVDRARQINVELLELDELMATADFLTLHVARTPDTVGMIDAGRLALAKPELRLVNVARGGIVDEAALAEAISAGTIAGAALDVFDSEPLTESPLFGLESVVVTPHLGASTREAQDKAGLTIAEQVQLALAGEFVPFAVNVDAAEASEAVRPFLPLVEQLGALFAGLVGHLPDRIDVEFCGDIGGYDNKLSLLSVVKGLLSQVSDDPVSYVNALDLARDRGCEVRAITNASAREYVSSVIVRGGGHSIGGTLSVSGEPRLVLIDDHAVELPPSPHMIVIHNEDRPGMIGSVGRVLGDAEVNIDHMHIGRSPEGLGALMVLATSVPIDHDTCAALAEVDGIASVSFIELAREA